MKITKLLAVAVMVALPLPSVADETDAVDEQEADEIVVVGRSVATSSARIEVDPERLRPEKSEVLELVCDASRAREALGWESRTALEEGVERTVAWISEHLDDYKPGLYNI